jgi:hypothetical protein
LAGVAAAAVVVVGMLKNVKAIAGETLNGKLARVFK